MIKGLFKSKNFISMLMVCVILVGCFIPSINADTNINVKDFAKGIPWQPFELLKKVIFVNFDKNCMLDDYAYLASIPASVFSDGNTLFSSPLLFFQPKDTYPAEDKYRVLNDYPGTNYFMEDWMAYCNGQLDKMTLINVPKNELDSSWKARNYTTITSDDPYDVTSKIVLNDWSYADKAVISVIEKDYDKSINKTSNFVTGSISGNTNIESLQVKRTDGCSPEYQQFTVGKEYKYLGVHLWYPGVEITSKIPKFLGNGGMPAKIVLPAFPDPDLQVYCSYDGSWLLTNTEASGTYISAPQEKCFSYVYKPGTWRISVTNMPLKGVDGSVSHYLFGKEKGKILFYGNTLDAIRTAFLGKSVNNYNCDITMYPGTEIKIPDTPSFSCRDANFKLTWDNPNVNLGFSIIGPSGEEIDSSKEVINDKLEININQVGQCMPGEYYRAVVYSMNDIITPVNFKVEYSWSQNITKEEGDCIASACEGAILSSVLNSPMLYVSSSEVPKCTADTLYKLGVKELYIVDLGGYLSSDAMKHLSDIASVKEHFTTYKSVYDIIRDKTGSNDVIFSTVQPWSYWYYDESPSTEHLKPEGEFEGAFFFGPAAYAAAYHGSPLLLVDNHIELSGAVMWHNDFWRKHGNGYIMPPVAPMVLTGRRVYDFLDKYGFDKEGSENILTIADQYNIGPTWSRVFAGVGNPGDLIGTPVDTTNWISRCVFYPALIFENPALQGEVELINGSISERVQPTLLHPFKALRERLQYPYDSNLKIIRPSQAEKYVYPILQTYSCYDYRFNERASKYWGTVYQTRDGIIPGQTISLNEIDQGTREKYEGISGCFYPDISESEYTAFYASKAGYQSVFSTNYDITMENLNKGVITWYEVLHGDSHGGGIMSWYDPASVQNSLQELGINLGSRLLQNLLAIPFGLYPLKAEINPWRGYDTFWGSTEEPDTAAMNTKVGLILGILGLANPNGPFNGGFIKTGFDLIPTNIPLFKFNRKDYFDGMVGPYDFSAMFLKNYYTHTAKEVDDKLENLHSMSLYSGSCLTACKYLQIAFMRHGSVAQEIDPWATSYYSGFPFQMIPRDIALGKNIGEIYTEGRESVGIKYLFEKNETIDWWWDNAENVVLFADPKLRVYCPSTEYSDNNYWEQSDIKSLKYDAETSFDGHMPFGVTSYPNEKKPVTFLQQYLWFIVVIIVIVVLVIAVVAFSRKKK